jgi:hypothetical protein
MSAPADANRDFVGGYGGSSFPICPSLIWVDRYVMRMTALAPSLPLDLANAVAGAELDDFGWLEPEIAAEFYAFRQANRTSARLTPPP